MDALFFFTRHTPFWAVPIGMICGEFAYIYWVKGNNRVVYSFLSVAAFCFLYLLFYFAAGGPEHSVGFLRSLLSGSF